MKIIISLSMLFLTYSLSAQTETVEKKKFEFSGSVDAFLDHDLEGTKSLSSFLLATIYKF